MKIPKGYKKCKNCEGIGTFKIFHPFTPRYSSHKCNICDGKGYVKREKEK